MDDDDANELLYLYDREPDAFVDMLENMNENDLRDAVILFVIFFYVYSLPQFPAFPSSSAKLRDIPWRGTLDFRSTPLSTFLMEIRGATTTVRTPPEFRVPSPYVVAMN